MHRLKLHLFSKGEWRHDQYKGVGRFVMSLQLEISRGERQPCKRDSVIFKQILGLLQLLVPVHCYNLIIQINTFFLLKIEYSAVTLDYFQGQNTEIYMKFEMPGILWIQADSQSITLFARSKKYWCAIQIIWPKQFKWSNTPVWTNLHFPFHVNANRKHMGKLSVSVHSQSRLGIQQRCGFSVCFILLLFNL